MTVFLLGAGSALAYVILGLIVYRVWYLEGPAGEYGWWGTWGYLAEIGILLTWPLAIPVAIIRQVAQNYREIKEERQNGPRLRGLPEFTGVLKDGDPDLSTRGVDELRGRD